MKPINLKELTYNFSIEIVHLIKSLPKKRIYWEIGDQLMRSGTSIGANVIEAQGASSRRDFIKFYQIAFKSSNETIYWIKLLRDTTDIRSEKTIHLLREAKELNNMLGASLITLKKKI